jgi:hypothetical protein
MMESKRTPKDTKPRSVKLKDLSPRRSVKGGFEAVEHGTLTSTLTNRSMGRTDIIKAMGNTK